jgi:hypothetical protein
VGRLRQPVPDLARRPGLIAGSASQAPITTPTARSTTLPRVANSFEAFEHRRTPWSRRVLPVDTGKMTINRQDVRNFRFSNSADARAGRRACGSGATGGRYAAALEEDLLDEDLPAGVLEEPLEDELPVLEPAPALPEVEPLELDSLDLLLELAAGVDVAAAVALPPERESVR